jgi:hypothetical protein
MRRSCDRDYIAASWQRMERLTSDATPEIPFWRARRKLEELRSAVVESDRKPRVCGQPSELDPTELIAMPPGFDPDAYLAANPDVLAAGANPADHYRLFGWHEGRPFR